MVAPGVCARLDRHEPVAPIRVGEHSARSVEMRVERGGVVIAQVPIAAGRIGLPDLDEGVWHGTSVLVEDAAGHDDALPLRLARVLPGEIVVGLADRQISIDRRR
jgi:hypothetical protein